MSLLEGKPTGAYESLATYIDSRNSECLNESDDHPFKNCLEVKYSFHPKSPKQAGAELGQAEPNSVQVGLG